MNTLLPEYKETITIKDMILGEEGFVVPWAMFANPDRTLWLNGNYTFGREPGGTVQMLVKKVTGGYEIDVSLCPDKTWLPVGANYVGRFDELPVVDFIQ